MAAKDIQQEENMNRKQELVPFWLDSSPLEDTVYEQDDDGDTELHIMILWGRQMEDKVIRKITSTADVSRLNLLNDFSYSLLHMAALGSYPKIIEILIDKGAYLWFQNDEGNTALHIACKNNDIECARLLLRGALSENMGDRAVLSGFQRVKELEIYNKEGQTCLHIAAMNNNKELIRVLLLHGAHVAAKTTTHGFTALQIAIERKFFKLANFLSQKCMSNLLMANLMEDPEDSFRNHLYKIERLYEQDRFGDTQLHHAIVKGIPYEHIAMKIISSTASEILLDRVNIYLQSALHLAASTRSWRVCRALLERGANPCLQDRDGNTALHLACINDDIKCVEALMYRNSEDMAIDGELDELQIHNDIGDTCLHIAVSNDNMSVANLVLLHGADIEAMKYHSGFTALHVATDLDHRDMVGFLLKKWKANVNAETYVDKTAYEIAMKKGYQEIADLLIEFGAYICVIPDSENNEALHGDYDCPKVDEN